MKKTMKSFASLLALLFVFVSFPVPNASAAESLIPSTGGEVQLQNVPNPPSVYVSVNVNHYKTADYPIPPGYYYHTQTRNNINYGGTLTRYSYANAGEYWLVTYVGYIHPIKPK